MRTLPAVLLMATLAATATFATSSDAMAQGGNPYGASPYGANLHGANSHGAGSGMAFRPQTAMTALGQTNLLRANTAAAAARPAARHGMAPGAPPAGGPTVRPFSSSTNRPVVSPYLNLFRDEQDQGAPNYFAFVRPQIEMQQLAQQQQDELARLQRQVRQANYTTQAPSTAARFGDTSRFYRGWRR